ncbi:MAG: hypothetical protein H0V44_15315 [Planctomycetes bacterium]|nr:hypothetical protein [Planctomycetota bacterium]
MTAQTPEELISLVLDGHPDSADIARLLRAIDEDPRLLRLMRQHLIISEVASQVVAPERRCEPFIAGMWQRHRAEQDALAYTERVMSKIRHERTRAIRAAKSLVWEIGGMSAAALLLVSLMMLTVRSVAERMPMAPVAENAENVDAERVPRALDLRIAAFLQRRSVE